MIASAVLPVKRFAAANQRLGMRGGQRRALAAAMLEDVLEAISASRMVERTILVSGERAAVEIGSAAGAELVDDPKDSGHPHAATLGIERAKQLGATCVALLPGDCPLLDPRELDSLLTGVPENYVAIVPDRHGTGTNSLVLSPPDAIQPAFGEGSRERHTEAARAAGIPYSVEAVDSLALDLDTPADIIALTTALDLGARGAARTSRVLGI